MNISERLSETGYDALAQEDRIRLLLTLADCRNIPQKMKQINDQSISLADVFLQSDKVSGIFTDDERKRIGAIQALSKSFLEEDMRSSEAYSSPQKAVDYFRLKHQGSEVEKLEVMFLDSKNHLIKSETIASGTVDHSIIYPREVMKKALDLNASSVIIGHNHPSGNCSPSNDDIRLTQAIADCLSFFDIKVLDHLIVGKFDRYFSFTENNLNLRSNVQNMGLRERKEDYSIKKDDNSLLKKINEKLEILSKNLDSEDTEMQIREYLKFSTRFYTYSLCNQLLIYTEAMRRNYPVEQVAGFRTWAGLKGKNSEKVHVKRGEKGFTILVPLPLNVYQRKEDGSFRLDEKGDKVPLMDKDGKPVRRMAFTTGTVFDVRQTNAIEVGAFKEKPQYRDVSAVIDGKVLEKIAAKIRDKGVKVLFNVELRPDIGGRYDHKTAEICINCSSLRTPAMQLSSLFHEYGHHVLHGKKLLNNEIQYVSEHNQRGYIEGEAEAFSYALSSMFGIENKSEFYLKKWGNSGKDIKEKMESISSGIQFAVKHLELEQIVEDIRNTQDKRNVIDASRYIHPMPAQQQMSFSNVI
ncbi:MAG: DNA repair protein RadC [Victivallales bacterium]